MTGPELPLCHGTAIISNDWQYHKLASVFIVWFTFCFQSVLRYPFFTCLKQAATLTLSSCSWWKNKTVIIPFTTPVYFSARCKCILSRPEHQRFMFVVGTAEHQLSFKKRQLKTHIHTRTHTQCEMSSSLLVPNHQ